MDQRIVGFHQDDEHTGSLSSNAGTTSMCATIHRGPIVLGSSLPLVVRVL